MKGLSLKALGFSRRGEVALAKNRATIFRTLITDNCKLTTNQGFTLVELLVSVSIFIIVITIAVGCLLVLIDANAKARNMQEVMTNLSFAVDSMSREIRTGRGYYCSDNEIDEDLDEDEVQDCEHGTNLSIVEGGESLTGDASGARISYRYNPNSLAIDRRIGDGGWFPITSHNMTITEMYFFVDDTEVGRNDDDEQANVTIYIEGHAGDLATVDSTFEVQATIAKRILDI